jgi:hypothetical protein
MQPVNAMLNTEASTMELVALNHAAVPDALRDLATTRPNLTDAQRHLQDETIRSLERRAYRSAIVMGWALAYDLIRQWAWDDPQRQQQLRNALIAKNKPEPTVYAEFFRLPLHEWDVLQAFRDAGFFDPRPDRLHDTLKECLRDRNTYAHANDSAPDVDDARSYVRRVLRIATSHPFV